MLSMIPFYAPAILDGSWSTTSWPFARRLLIFPEWHPFPFLRLLSAFLLFYSVLVIFTLVPRWTFSLLKYGNQSALLANGFCDRLNTTSILLTTCRYFVDVSGESTYRDSLFGMRIRSPLDDGYPIPHHFSSTRQGYRSTAPTRRDRS